MTECDRETSVPEWLIEHPEILPVLRELGIDYSCGGKSLEFACEERALDVDSVIATFCETIEANRSMETDTDH